MSNWGLLIRDRRRELGMSQADLASEIKMSSSYIAKIETGKQKPSSNLVNKLISALELPVDSITDMIFPESTYIAMKNLQEVDKELLSLRPEVKRSLLKLAPIIEEIV